MSGTESNRASGSVEETELYLADESVVRILEDYLEALKTGQAPTREQLLAQYPQLAVQLEACLAGIDFIHASQTEPTKPQQLGDFRIIREVGRGGMGAVFEAEQVSLGRRVALKILRFGSVSDKDAIERFQREAETIAGLHHTNIVPVYFVGSERGVNYYAMQFIEGRNLAEVMSDHDAKLDPMQVAEWALQAAEALSHAHRRGVIHRDVKPSNLILDKDNRLWLTDFGLARRADDVTLSMTGMLLGTPRYMSPEHARASSKRIDQRSDLFSLGATLYELLTRTPAFPGDVPHDVIQKILGNEPVPIRQLNAEVPRDLETIVMKCLAKEPTERYATADDLASDLRALLEDRPIRARRASSFEQAKRWLKQNQRSVSQVSTAAVLTLVLTFTTILSWVGYQSWNSSNIRFDAQKPPLVAELLTKDGVLVRTDTLPMQNPVTLPAGDYQLRVSADGTFSHDFDVTAERGRVDTRYTVNVTDQWLTGLQPIQHSFDTFERGSERALVFWNDQGISVRKQQGPDFTWSLELSPATTPLLAKLPGYRNPPKSENGLPVGFGDTNITRPWMLQEFIDVDGDEVGDIVCAARHQAWVMAISGAGKGVLWVVGRGDELHEAPSANASRFNQTATGSVLHSPLRSNDLDNDGIDDLVVSFVSLGKTPRAQQNVYECERWIEAFSSRTGESIWRFDLSDELFDLRPNEEVPYDLRWFANVVSGRSTRGGHTMPLNEFYLRIPPSVRQSGAHAYSHIAPALVQIASDKPPCIAVIAGDKLALIDQASGTPLGPETELGFRPGREVQWADVDGDGLSDLIALEESLNPQSQAVQARLNVWSLVKQARLWSKGLDAYWPSRHAWSASPPPWPLVVDLDGDGKSEILVPDGRSHTESLFNGPNSVYQMPRGRLALYAGMDGAMIWDHSIANIDASVDYFVDGPDIDDDGKREVFAVTCDPTGTHLHVDALSGANGRILWGARDKVPSDSVFDSFRTCQLQWWQSGSDGWSQLLVSLSNDRHGLHGNRESTVLAFSAGTGCLTKVGKKIAELKPIDLDQDGAEELIVCSHETSGNNERGSLHLIRGIGREAWSRLGSLGRVAVDFDRDGVRDLIESWGDGTLIATSGNTGRPIWRSRAIRTTSQLRYRVPAESVASQFPTPKNSCTGDLNEDGYEDLVVFETQSSGQMKTPLHAISGRDGSLLWSLQDVLVKSISNILSTMVIDIDGDGADEVICLAAVDYGYPPSPLVFSNQDVQLWLFVASGKTGKLRWSHPLSPAYGIQGNSTPPLQFSDMFLDLACADLNADGFKDILVPAVNPDDSLETRAVSGKDGKVLWSRARQDDGLSRQSLENWTPPGFCDFDGDGRPEVILIEPHRGTTSGSVHHVDVGVALLDADGQELWVKSTGSVFTHFNSFSQRKGELLRPIAIQTKSQENVEETKTHCFVLVLPSDSRIIAFDADGQTRERKLANDGFSNLDKLYSLDVDGDRREELFFVERSELVAIRADNFDEMLWKRPLSNRGPHRILKVIDGNDGMPPLVVVLTDPTHNVVLSFDAVDGDNVWNCPGPIARTPEMNAYMTPSEISLLSSDRRQPPLVYFGFGTNNTCRQAMLSPKQATASLMESGVQRAFASTQGLSDDPRSRRALPWQRMIEWSSRMSIFVMWGSFFAVTLIVIPTAYLVSMVRRRRFGLGYLMMLPFVAVIVLQAALLTAPYDNDFNTILGRLSIGLAFTPPLLALFQLGNWFVNRRWRPIVTWLIVLISCTVLFATFLLVTSLRTSPMLEDQRFDWTGWYQVFLPGAYITSWLMIFAWIIGFINVDSSFAWLKRRKAHRFPTTIAPDG